MPVVVTNLPDATLIVETRPSGDGKGTVRTERMIPNAGTPAANQDTLMTRGLQALQENRDTIQAIQAFPAGTPTNAQVVTQMRLINDALVAAAQQRNGIIRLLLGQLDGTN